MSLPADPGGLTGCGPSAAQAVAGDTQEVWVQFTLATTLWPWANGLTLQDLSLKWRWRCLLPLPYREHDDGEGVHCRWDWAGCSRPWSGGPGPPQWTWPHRANDRERAVRESSVLHRIWCDCHCHIVPRGLKLTVILAVNLAMCLHIYSFTSKCLCYLICNFCI